MLQIIFLQYFFPFTFSSASLQEITIENNQATITFPERISFSASISSDSEIKEVVLEYGVNQLTCGKLVSKAFPDFEPGNNVDVEWTWEMKQSGSLVTGSRIWWRWVVTNESGQDQNTETQTIVWIDNSYNWKKITAPNINLYWYKGDNTFGADLLNTAKTSLSQLEDKFGLTPDSPIDIYIFASSDELVGSMYYQSDWTGGLASPENHIIMIGIPLNQLDWGRHAETHELAHILVGSYTFSCLSSIPRWLDEGIAMYSEGDWDTQSDNQFKQAVRDDEIFSVQILNSSFPEDAAKANLAYSQSKSLVAFLIDNYDKDKILSLFAALRDGADIDSALKEIYGFDQDGLEDAWRASVGAKPRVSDQSEPTLTAAPTQVPTIVPIEGIKPQATATAKPSALASETATPLPLRPTLTPTLTNGPSGIASILGNDFESPVPAILIATVCGGLTCLVVLAIVIVLIIMLIKRQKNKKDLS